jgi:hypothetical protein
LQYNSHQQLLLLLPAAMATASVLLQSQQTRSPRPRIAATQLGLLCGLQLFGLQLLQGCLQAAVATKHISTLARQ